MRGFWCLDDVSDTDQLRFKCYCMPNQIGILMLGSAGGNTNNASIISYFIYIIIFSIIVSVLHFLLSKFSYSFFYFYFFRIAKLYIYIYIYFFYIGENIKLVYSDLNVKLMIAVLVMIGYFYLILA